MHDFGDLAIGAIFVLISASSRFNTPPTNRSSTTALRYHTASLCYLLLGMALYFGLYCFPPIVEAVSTEMGFFKAGAKSLEAISTAPLIALLLTLLVDRIPPLADADNWVREHLQKMAAIPYEARRLAADLRKSRHSISPSLQEAVMRRLVGLGFHADDVLFDDSTSLKHLWTKVSALMIQLEEWEGDRKFGSFLARHEGELGDLKRQWRQLAPKVRLLYGIAPGDAVASGDRLMLLVQDELTEQSSALLAGIYSLVSRGLLQCGTTNGARALSLASLGFDIRTVNPKPKLTLDHFMTLSMVILGALLPGITIVYRFTGARIGELLNQSLMVSTIYCAAVICAVYPKDHWKFARRSQHNLRPMSFYLTAGLLATAASLVIRFVFQLMLYHLPKEALLRSQLGFPWSVCAFVAAFMVAWMIDDEPTSRMPPARLRWIEALAGGSSLALASPLVVTWLAQVTHHIESAGQMHLPPPPPLPLALVSSFSIGFVIGYLVPTWYRQARHKDVLATEAEIGNEAMAAAA